MPGTTEILLCGSAILGFAGGYGLFLFIWCFRSVVFGNKTIIYFSWISLPFSPTAIDEHCLARFIVPLLACCVAFYSLLIALTSLWICSKSPTSPPPMPPTSSLLGCLACACVFVTGFNVELLVLYLVLLLLLSVFN